MSAMRAADPLSPADAYSIAASVDACRDDVRRVERKLDEHAAASRRRDESTRGAVAHNTDEIFRLSQTLTAMGKHLGMSDAELRRDGKVTRAIALVRIPFLLASGALLLRLVQLYLKGH